MGEFLPRIFSAHSLPVILCPNISVTVRYVVRQVHGGDAGYFHLPESVVVVVRTELYFVTYEDCEDWRYGVNVDTDDTDARRTIKRSECGG